MSLPKVMCRYFNSIFSSLFIGLLSLTAFSCGKGTGSSDSESMSSKNAEAALPPITRKSSNVPIPQGPRHNDRIRVNDVGKLWEVFNDSNKYQYAHAERLGITPVNCLRDAYFSRRPLVKIETCDAYYVDSLSHSVPYLVPEAANLLKQVGYSFIDSLASRGADGYRIKVTSLLRTPMHVQRLRRVNVNSTDSSTHQFGTTFDISWSKFVPSNPDRTIHEGDLKNLLAEVLNDLHRQGRCMVKYERKTACFHITAIK